MSKEIEEQIVQPKRGINWTTEKIMSTSALFISVISLIALLYQSYLAREENKLIQKQQSASVLPHLSHWFSHTGDAFRIVIGNKGVGPAFISDVLITYKDTITFNKTDNFLRFMFKNESALDTINYTYNTLSAGYVLPANNTTNIIEIEGRNNVETFRDVFFKSSIRFTITYKDVYGEEWEITDATSIPKKRISID